MKKKLIKNLMVVLAVVMLCFVVGVTASALEATGQCGDNVYWNYDETTGELVISGEGAMWDYGSSSESPFFLSEIKSIKFTDGVTKVGNKGFGHCLNLVNVEISDSITAIGDYSFSGCYSLTSMVIPDGVITIGEYAFAGDVRISLVTIGSGVETIGKEAFYECNSLTKIIVDENNKYFYSDDNGVLFNKDKNVLIKYPSNNSNKKYEIPYGVTYIGESAFASCCNLTEISIPDSVEIIDEWAFNGCLRLTNIVVPESVKTIRMCSFSALLFLEKIVIKSMNAELDTAALCYSQIKASDDVSPEYLVELFTRYQMTYDDELMEEVYLYMIQAEDDELFSFGTIYCHAGSDAEAYAIENGCDYVITHFFEGDWIYDSENKISYRQCIHCDEREISEEVGDPDTDANKCGDNLYWSFDETTGTLTISGEGSMYDFDNKLYHRPWEDLKLDIKSVIIGDGVTTIGKNAFFLCYNLTKVQLPDSLTTIGCQAFCHCVKLAEIAIPNSLTTIGEAAFQLCFSLKEIVVSEYIEKIDTLAFTVLPFTEKIVVRSMTAEIGEFALCATPFIGVKDISLEDFIELYIQSQISDDSSLSEEVDSKWIYAENGIAFIGTIYAHTGSKVETYADTYGIEFVPTHFFEGDWIYDSENKNFYRQCIHCDEREISEEIGDVEIEAPVIPGTDFTVDVVEDYVVIEETISNNVTVDFEIIKAFDINLKNSDGVHIQPDGSVKVKLPNDWSKSGVYKVYRVNDDGTLTDMNAYRQGSHLVFDTDHFSVYVIVVEDEAPTEPEAPETPDEEVKSTLFTKLVDLIKSFIELVRKLFNF